MRPSFTKFTRMLTGTLGRGRALLAAPVLLALVGCANYGIDRLVPGESNHATVEQAMGAPAMRWRDADGSEQLAYPTGPAGMRTFMVRIGPNGKLISIKNVLDPATLHSIGAGMSEAEVLRLVGPPTPHWTQYFKARDELVWEWRYCDEWSQSARFDVLFDGTTHMVRSTMARPEYLLRYGMAADFNGGWCSR